MAARLHRKIRLCRRAPLAGGASSHRRGNHPRQRHIGRRVRRGSNGRTRAWGYHRFDAATSSGGCAHRGARHCRVIPAGRGALCWRAGAQSARLARQGGTPQRIRRFGLAAPAKRLRRFHPGGRRYVLSQVGATSPLNAAEAANAAGSRSAFQELRFPSLSSHSVASAGGSSRTLSTPTVLMLSDEVLAPARRLPEDRLGRALGSHRVQPIPTWPITVKLPAEAVDRANLNAVGASAPDAILGNDEGHRRSSIEKWRSLRGSNCVPALRGRCPGPLDEGSALSLVQPNRIIGGSDSSGNPKRPFLRRAQPPNPPSCASSRANFNSISCKNISSGAAGAVSLNEAGFEAYLVGGAVRDRCSDASLGISTSPFSATPEQVKQLFRNRRLTGGALPGAHRLRPQIIEVATFRAGDDDGSGDREMENGCRCATTSTALEETPCAATSPPTRSTTRCPISRCGITPAALTTSPRALRLIGDPESRYREDPRRRGTACGQARFTIEAASAEPIAPPHRCWRTNERAPVRRIAKLFSPP